MYKFIKQLNKDEEIDMNEIEKLNRISLYEECGYTQPIIEGLLEVDSGNVEVAHNMKEVSDIIDRIINEGINERD